MADDSYEIGFGKPPKDKQFRKGRSGNPKGRPKGSKKNIYVQIREILDEKVRVKGNGGTHSMTKIEAALVQLANKAASGDVKALREVLRLREKVEAQEPHLAAAPEFVIRFIKPGTKEPATAEDLEIDKQG